MQPSREVSSLVFPLALRIKDGHPDVHYFAYYLEYLTFHMAEGRLIPALQWLIKNKLTGDKFLNLVKNECKRSGLELVRYLTMRIEREKNLRSLTAKDVGV